jgi:hypothetical protein
MLVDRQRFLMLVLGLGVGRVAAGCIVVEDPAPQQGDTTSGGDRTVDANAAYEPGAECVSWDATGECVGYAYDQTAPTDECTGWDPSGECVAWGDSAGPVDECVNWDPSGECIGWESDGSGYAPTQECVSWDPSGECIGWQPAYES